MPRPLARIDIAWFLFATGVLLAIAGALAVQLLAEPVIGVADNGDYHRVMTPLGLEPTVSQWSERYFDHLNLKYTVVEREPATFPTTEVAVGRVALLGMSTGDTFDLRRLGAVNAGLYLLGIALLLLALKPLGWTARGVGAFLLFLAATDVTTIAFFNSFYSESATLIFLVLTVGVYLVLNRRRIVRPWQVLLFLAIGIGFAAAKPQNLLLIAVVVGLPVPWLLRTGTTNRWIVWALGSVAALGICGMLYLQVPEAIKQYNRWNVVFYSLLPDADDPRADLIELGLDPELARYSGSGAFAPDVPVESAVQDITHADLARFFLRHPGRGFRLAERCANQCYVKFDPVHGQFTKASGRAARSQSTNFAAWSHFQASVLPRSLGWLGFLLVLTTGAVAWVQWKCGLRSEAGGIAWLQGGLTLMAAMQLGICVVGDGAYDAVKHLYLFQLLLDTGTGIAAVWIAGGIARAADRWIHRPEIPPSPRIP